MFVGSAPPVLSRSVATGRPDTWHDAFEVFVTTSAQPVCPAPALPGMAVNVACRSAPLHGGALAGSAIVVAVVFVTVFTVVVVCVTVTVVFEPQPSASTATMTPRTSAYLTASVSSRDARAHPRARSEHR